MSIENVHPYQGTTALENPQNKYIQKDKRIGNPKTSIWQNICTITTNQTASTATSKKEKKWIVHTILHSTFPAKSKVPKILTQCTKVLPLCDQHLLGKMSRRPHALWRPLDK